MRLSTSAKRVNPRPEDDTTTLEELREAKKNRLANYIRKEEERRSKDAISKTSN